MRSPFEPAPVIEAMRASAASTSAIVSEGSAAASGGTRVAQQRVADAASSLPRLAGKIGDAGFDFRRRELAEAGGELGGLGVATGCFGDAARSFDELGQ